MLYKMNGILRTLLGSRVRAKLLGWLFTHPDERYFVRQLAAFVEEDSTNMSRELARLERAGILVSTTEGRQKYYQANRQSPLFNELHELIVKTVGMGASPVFRPFRLPHDSLAKFCHKHHIRKLSLFGSVLTKDFRPDSDIDVLVEFEPDHVPGFAIIDIENELSRLVGRKVDLRMPGDLSRYFRDRVVREAKVEYAETQSQR
jgi:predicted nucleotidyltransferase